MYLQSIFSVYSDTAADIFEGENGYYWCCDGCGACEEAVDESDAVDGAYEHLTFEHHREGDNATA